MMHAFRRCTWKMCHRDTGMLRRTTLHLLPGHRDAAESMACRRRSRNPICYRGTRISEVLNLPSAATRWRGDNGSEDNVLSGARGRQRSARYPPLDGLQQEGFFLQMGFIFLNRVEYPRL
jgi:hypothetical protein